MLNTIDFPIGQHHAELCSPSLQQANNMVIRGALDFYSVTGRRGTPHLIISDIEHDAVEEPVADLQRRRLCSGPSRRYTARCQ